MPEESKEVYKATDHEAAKALAGKAIGDDAAHEDSGENEFAASEISDAAAAGAAAQEKKSKKTKLKSALGVESQDASVADNPGKSTGRSTKDASDLSDGMLKQLLENNPALKNEIGGMGKEKAEEKLKKLNLSDLLTGLAVGGKNQKDMASYKFWQTQPVPRFDDQAQSEEGPIKMIDPERVPKEPSPLVEGFGWDTMDLTNEKQLEEVYELLTGHYVEDDEAMFRFNYSVSFLKWALMSPGWRKEWHIGVRASQSRKLVAFISGVPVELRVRSKVLHSSEINFLCIHKKLRSKRLAPVLIKEITRRCYAVGVWQAIYTAGVVLPKPVSTCQYFHRSLDWLKLYEVGFSPLPPKSTKARQITKYHLPNNTATKGLRPMESRDIDGVLELLRRYLKRFDMAQEFTREEVDHWLLHEARTNSEQVVWTYVVEEPQSHRISDFFSFYCLESSVIGNKKHHRVRAAYLFYYATETAFENDEKEKGVLRARLNTLMSDALILAKRFNFDVFNALTLLDNPLFLEAQKFGAGDGRLNYYLYNYRTTPIDGGIDSKDAISDKHSGGVGVVML
ncbi:MAG: glycylpeptide N-tetradecanoyltransferase [Pycnora praestabilis]|nr:MAG: glycylpeptide N-tetradecanoyltransferase [Pycnora praestabilis]